MSGDSRIAHSPRARPVADAPVEALLARADELARRWAIALIVARPLEEMAEIPLEDLAREAPALCAQVIRALESDAELERLAAGGELGVLESSTQVSRLGALSRAPDARDAVHEVEALRGVLWEALLEQLRWPNFDSSTAGLVADLSDRLAHVCATALAAMLAQSPTVGVEAPYVEPSAGREEVLYTSPPASQGKRAAVLVDERADVPRPPRDAGRRAHAEERVGPAGESAESFREPPLDPPETRRPFERRRTEARPRPLPWDTPPRSERGARRPPEARVEGTGAGESSEPVMRITRRSTAPVDERT